MALSLMVSAGWVLAATLVSCLPIRQQHVPGVVRFNEVRIGLIQGHVLAKIEPGRMNDVPDA